MITGEQFEWILTQAEGQQIDFKRDPYQLKEDDGRAGLTKDVLSMANTPRDGNSYIVLGVKAYADGRKDMVGLLESVDDNEHQNVLKSKVYPCPRFVYVPIQYQGKDYGVIEISPDRRGPFQATVDVGGKVRRYVIYWRRGTQNDEAKLDEQEMIRSWAHGDRNKKESLSVSDEPSTPWERLLAAAHAFESGRVYLLLAGPVTFEDAKRAAGLASLHWGFVFDFDANGLDS